jgi:TusA-related sulfurtransferase
MQVDKEIDTRGLNCPLPILKAKKALADMNSGQLLRVLSTDPGSNAPAVGSGLNTVRLNVIAAPASHSNWMH